MTKDKMNQISRALIIAENALSFYANQRNFIIMPDKDGTPKEFLLTDFGKVASNALSEIRNIKTSKKED